MPRPALNTRRSSPGTPAVRPQSGTSTGTTIAGAIYQRPWMYPKQFDAVWRPARYSVIEASSKSGKTISCLVWLAEQAMASRPGRNFWWVAPIYPQARIAYRRLKAGLPPALYTAHEGELKLTLANGAVIWFKGSTDPDSLYGEDVYAAVVDEATRVLEPSWHALRSTLTATKGPVRIIGNVKGRKNWAYKLARRAEAGEPDMHYAKITARDAIEAGILDAAEIEDAERVLPASVFRELYFAEPSDDGGNPFGLAAIVECVAPLSTGYPVAWGVDLAKSTDYTVAIALDAAGAVCSFSRWQAPWRDTIRRLTALVGKVPALVDSTGVGDPVLEELQAAGGLYTGYPFTSGSKQQLMEGLAVAIQRHAVRFPDGVIRHELESYEYQYSQRGVKYGAPEGEHDDCVVALALAVEHWRSAARSPWEQAPRSVPFLDLDAMDEAALERAGTAAILQQYGPSSLLAGFRAARDAEQQRWLEQAAGNGT